MTVGALAIVALVPFIILSVALRPVDDPDAFWHVLSGQNVWRTRDVVTSDPFGRFSANEWVQIDWLSDLLMYASYVSGALPGVAWLYVAMAVILFAALYRACRDVAPPLVAGVIATVAWAGTSASQGFRPQTISFILLVVTLMAWQRVRRGGSTPWWLVALSWVWACSHGLWFMGPLVGGAVVVGLALDRARPPRELLRLLAVPVASGLVAMATPIGPRLLTAPLTVSSYAGLVTEWRPPDLHEPYVAATVLLILVVAAGWALSVERAPAPDLLLWVMAVGWTLLYARTVAVGAVILATLAAGALTRLTHLDPEGTRSRLERLVIPLSVVGAVALAGALAPGIASRPGNMPTPVAAGIDRLPRDTVVLNDDGAGGWLLLAHPEVHPVIDTRTYLFDIPYIERYMAARAARPGWERFVEETGATAAVLRSDEVLVPALVDDLGWSVTQSSGGWSVLAAPATR